MTNADFTDLNLKYLITHHIGNKLRDENVALSSELSILDEDTKQVLLKYFLSPVKTMEFFAFSHSVKLDMNEVFTVSKNIFADINSFIENSQNIAKLLYEQSLHPKIREGELNIAYFSGIHLADETIEAIGIFKSETNVPYIKMQKETSKFLINHDYGYELKGIDKGCIVFNTSKEDGFKVLIIDNTDRAVETKYWKDNFLNVKPINDEYHQTNQFLTITKNFVTKQIEEDFELTKTDKIDLLNRSVEYFKTHNSFEQSSFENEVFEHDRIIKSFRNFDEKYRNDNSIISSNNFEISQQAVKKQARTLRNVLKLDKNFDIYIHSKNGIIEQGVDENGRKFYKLFYQNEK